MTSLLTTREAFVLFPMGKKRFAVSATQVSELARSQSSPHEEAHWFPHTTPLIAGVVLRRNQIVPVADLAPVLIGPDAPERKFYLIINRQAHGKTRRMAIPVTGECELADAEQLPVTGKLPSYVCGLLSLKEEIVEVLDIERLMSSEARL